MRAKAGQGLRGILIVLACGVCLAAAPRSQRRTPAAPPTPVPGPTSVLQAPAVPVKYRGHTLFEIRASLGPFTPTERARAVEARLAEIERQHASATFSVTVLESGGQSTVVLDGLAVTAVTDVDARAAGKSRAALAAQEASAIRLAFESYRHSISTTGLLLSVLYALLLTAALIGLLRLIANFAPALERRVRRWEEKLPSLRIQSVELISSRRMVAFAAGMFSLLRWLFTLVLLYFYLVAVLSLFPWTRGYAPVLLSYVTTPIHRLGLQVLSYIPNLLVILVAVVFTRLVLRFARMIFTEIGRGTIRFANFYPEWAQPTYKIVRVLIVAILLVVIFPYLPGSSSPAFRGVSIFLGVLFSLGSGSSMANIISGVVLTYTRSFQVGDRVKIADSTGDVIERTLLMTRVRTIKNEDISIPNSVVMSNPVINYSNAAAKQHDGLILHTSVTIGYDAPWRTVHELLIAAATSVRGIEHTPAPFVLQTALDDFYVSYQINAYTRHPREMARLYSDLHQAIQDKFNEGGVEIMSAHYHNMRDGNETTIPQQYRPGDYRAPGFRVERVTAEDNGQQINSGGQTAGGEG